MTDLEPLYSNAAFSGMEIVIEDLPYGARKWEVKEAFSKVLHNPPFFDPNAPRARLVNFEIQFDPSYNGLPNKGTGKIILPDRALAEDFWRWACRRGNGVWVSVQESGRPRKVYLRRNETSRPSRTFIESLNKTPYVDPREQALREDRLARIAQYRIILDVIQLGVYFHRYGDSHTANRVFSNEFEILRDDTFAGELLFDYDHKLLRIEMGDPVSEDTAVHIVIDIANLNKSAYGTDPSGQYYVCLDLWSPPRFERQQRLRQYSGDKKSDKKKFRERLPHLGDEHEVITQYAYQLRLLLNSRRARHDLKALCAEADIRAPAKVDIAIETKGFFRPSVLNGVRAWSLGLDWPVRFQVEALLRNGLVNTGDLLAIRFPIERLMSERPTLAGNFLRRFSERLRSKGTSETVLECFETALRAEEEGADTLLEFSETDSSRPKGSVECSHAIITPSRVLLEGPYDTQSNRIVRRYYDYREYFLRVEFRDENKMSLRWPKEVNGRSLIEQRFGSFLKNGLDIAGRLFRFLGYSTSGLREHTVWFMAEFEHPEEGLVTPDKIRTDLGDFTKCIMQPSKYAARIAQAFSGTDPSVRIRRDQWEVVADLGNDPYEHTDGQGTISPQLRDKIWDVLVRASPGKEKLILKPSAYQIRFLGFKGVVVVDDELERLGIFMRLRPSMHKYDATETSDAEIEIAKAFIKPQTARLCRPLIAVLEDRGVRKEAFLNLQNDAKKEVIEAGDEMQKTVELLQKHDLGNVFGLRWILQHLQRVGVGMTREQRPRPPYTMGNAFIVQLLKSAQTHILREIKHDARITIKDAHQLVGVVDEGPTYYVFCLAEGEIFACVQKPDSDEPQYIKGSVSISRSPHIHPGDVQVLKAIGQPPDDKICFFRNLKNVVVMPSVGERSLASCLAGGDVDGDEFLIIKDGSLLPTDHAEPASYEAVKPQLLNRPSTIDDICDFFVEYMQSDVVGLVADQHLIIADQSKDGTFDRDCMALAKLCSQAVDYPKNGVPVDIENIPQAHIHAKPDWKKTEDNEGRPGDFYESDRALGVLFRNIVIKPFQPSTSSHAQGEPLEGVTELPLSDAISRALRRSVEGALGRFANQDEEVAALEPLYRHYARELGYICLTHAPADNMDVRLSEAEVAIGVILAKCSQPRWKRERMHRMREHAAQLVRDVKYRRRGLGAPVKKEVQKGKDKGKGKEASGDVGAEVQKDEEPAREEVVAALSKAWTAWDFGMRYRSGFGARSFGLIGLGVVCDMLEKLEKFDAVA